MAPAAPDGGLLGVSRNDSRSFREISPYIRTFGYAATALANSRGEWPNVRLNAAPNAL